MTSESILLKNGRIIDPSSNIDQEGDLLIKDGRCYKVTANTTHKVAKTVDLTGKWIMPGFIDMHVHLREPGEEYKETIESGTNAAAAGGFTAVACMPNTIPPTDNELAVSLILQKAKGAKARVYPVGTISKGIKGDTIAEFGEMINAGAVSFTDDGRPVVNSQLMRRALEYASNYGVALISHSEELCLCHKGTMNEGAWSTRLGLRGIPRVAEEIAVYRDISLAKYTNCPLHLAHISTKESVSLIRRAKSQGVPITAETAPHYFSLTEAAVDGYNTYAKMNPPLRTQEDVDAIKEGIKDGTLDAIATDHAPHSDLEKILEFDQAANGIIGLETAIPLTLRLVKEEVITPAQMVTLMSVNPARILGVKGGTLADGEIADITIIDPELKHTYSRDKIVSQSKNSPFIDWEFTGKAVLTIVDGKITYSDL